MRVLPVGAGEPGRRWHPRACLLQEFCSLESDPRIDVESPSHKMSVTDIQDVLYRYGCIWEGNLCWVVILAIVFYAQGSRRHLDKKIAIRSMWIAL